MPEQIRKTLVVIAVSVGLAILFYGYLHFSETAVFPSMRKSTSGILSSALIGSLIGLSLYYFNQKLDKWITWKNHFVGRFITGYFSNSIISLSICLAISGLIVKLSHKDIFWVDGTLNDQDLLTKLIILFLSSIFIYTIIYALLYSYQHYAVAQIESLQRERKQLELQFEALKSQISPHYLFNSLNTISSLLFKDLPSAEQFIRRLAQTYQYILATQHQRYVLLREEVEFVQSYYYLLRIRFQQQLSVEINLPSGIMDSKIPPLTLQMLVENAVKHNNLSSDKKLLIYITAQDNTYLKVINTKTNILDGVTSFKVGIENIRKRYHFFTDKAIEIRDDEKFTVSLPIIHNNNKEVVTQKYSA